MNNLYILGAVALGREMESWLQGSMEFVFPEYELKGFLHSGPNDLDQYPCDYKVVGDWETFDFAPGDAVLVGTADPVWKRKYVERLHGRVSFPTFIHPSVVIGKYSHIGEGTVVLVNSLISCNVTIGNFVTINTGSQFGHECVIEDFASVMSNSDFGGGSSLGEDSFVGTNATIIPHVHVGKKTRVGAGSVVVRNVPDRWHVFGNPATRLLVPGQK